MSIKKKKKLVKSNIIMYNQHTLIILPAKMPHQLVLMAEIAARFEAHV